MRVYLSGFKDYGAKYGERGGQVERFFHAGASNEM
jgi:hypothetical protein